MTARPTESASPRQPDELFVGVQSALAGEYSLERELGRGGMGVVYLAREVRLAREVALKVLPPARAASADMRDQFLREAQMAARLSHPNIVPIHRVDEANGFVYFVMTYVAGESLAERVRRHGPLPPHQAAQLLREIAWALTYAHGNGIVHRDIKADNILLERGSGRAIVTDFGIAALAQSSGHSANGQLVGSAHYMSPEQIAGEPADARSDLYSLGVVGYVALTGRFPFDGGSSGEIIAKHLRDPVPALSSIAPTVPPRLAQIVERCMAKRPEYRFESAAAFADALASAVDPPREIPAPIRVWLTQENQQLAPRLFVGAYLPLVVGSALATQSVVAGVAVALPLAVSVVLLPTLFRTRRVLAAGYGIDDIRIGLREYWIRRREEMVYEWSGSGGTGPATLLKVAGVSAVVAIIAGTVGPTLFSHSPYPGILVACAAAFGTGSVLLAIVRSFRSRYLGNLGKQQIKIWGGKWGQRLVKLASIGLKERAPAQALSQLTEVALGRATDALYAALPKELRKQLRALPDTVRRLESDATKLRAELEKLDASIVTLDADARGSTSAALRGSEREDSLRGQRDALRRDLRATRERAGSRLAATVAALENIRLDLLRLQLGDGHVESITATLDAARQIADDVGHQVAAAAETDALLRDTPRAGAHTAP